MTTWTKWKTIRFPVPHVYKPYALDGNYNRRESQSIIFCRRVFFLVYCLAAVMVYKYLLSHDHFPLTSLLLSLSLGIWQIARSRAKSVYLVNAEGIWISPLNDSIVPEKALIRWDRDQIVAINTGSWQGLPSLEIQYLHKNKGPRMVGIVYYPEDADIVTGELIPMLKSKFPNATVQQDTQNDT